MATSIQLVPIGRDRFDAFFEGKRIASGPLDACRALKALGITGILEVSHAGSSVVAMRLDIERAARLTIIESVRHGPKLAPWQPYSPAAHGKAIAVSPSEHGAASL